MSTNILKIDVYGYNNATSTNLNEKADVRASVCYRCNTPSASTRSHPDSFPYLRQCRIAPATNYARVTEHNLVRFNILFKSSWPFLQLYATWNSPIAHTNPRTINRWSNRHLRRVSLFCPMFSNVIDQGGCGGIVARGYTAIAECCFNGLG